MTAAAETTAAVGAAGAGASGALAEAASPIVAEVRRRSGSVLAAGVAATLAMTAKVAVMARAPRAAAPIHSAVPPRAGTGSGHAGVRGVDDPESGARGGGRRSSTSLGSGRSVGEPFPPSAGGGSDAGWAGGLGVSPIGNRTITAGRAGSNAVGTLGGVPARPWRRVTRVSLASRRWIESRIPVVSRVSTAAMRPASSASRSPATSVIQAPTSTGGATGPQPSSASAMARAVGKRPSASRERARITTASWAGEMPRTRVLGGSTEAWRSRAKSGISPRPAKRRAPTSASQSTTPAAYTSARRSSTSAWSCSGGMYPNLPLMRPSWVTCRRPAALAMPKSSTRATPSLPTRMFCGETSRWTTPSSAPPASRASCAACSPRRAPARMAATMRGGMRSLRRMAARMSADSAAPWTYSITTKSSPPLATTSSVVTTLRWWMRAASRPSSRSMAQISGSLAYWGWRRLMATVRANPASPSILPRWTVAIPPDAISSPIT